MIRVPPLRVIGLAALSTVMLAACQDQQQAAAPKPERPVLVERVRLEPRVGERSFVGTIRPRVESDLAFRVPGKVARRLVSVGDAVKAGQPLATLDEIDLRLQREGAEAEKAAATAALAQAQAELKRIETLIRQGWSTAANLDRQQAATEEARGRLVRAERSLSLAQNALSYAVLSADADGVVTGTSVEPGQVVATDKPAIRIARTGEKEAAIAIPETLIGQARSGRAGMTLWSNPGRRYEATLRELSPTADPATRTFLARFALADAGPEVKLGMTATVTVGGEDGAKVARLPLSALYNGGDGPAVFVTNRDGRLALRPVTVASYEAREVLVSGGVAEGDEVVTLGVQKLDPAQRVRVVQALQF